MWKWIEWDMSEANFECHIIFPIIILFCSKFWVFIPKLFWTPYNVLKISQIFFNLGLIFLLISSVNWFSKNEINDVLNINVFWNNT